MRGSEGVVCSTLIWPYKFDRYRWSFMYVPDRWELLLLSLLAMGSLSLARLRVIAGLGGRAGQGGESIGSSSVDELLSVICSGI